MQTLALWVLAGLLAALGAVHFYWSAGGRWGLEASIPHSGEGMAVFVPTRSLCLGMAFSFLVGAAGVLALYDPWLKAQSLRAMALILALRAVGDFRYLGFTRRVRDTQFAFWDTYLYTPLCVLMAVLAVVASLG